MGWIRRRGKYWTTAVTRSRAGALAGVMPSACSESEKARPSAAKP